MPSSSEEVVDAIAAVQTNPRTDWPLSDIVIESVVIENR
jgi:peptidyl-prolyl cis-trans isomerase A (cyclophilin A)